METCKGIRDSEMFPLYKRGGLGLRARPELDVDCNNDNGANTVDGEPVIQFQSQSTVGDLVSKDERRRANA